MRKPPDTATLERFRTLVADASFKVYQKELDDHIKILTETLLGSSANFETQTAYINGLKAARAFVEQRLKDSDEHYAREHADAKRAEHKLESKRQFATFASGWWKRR